MGNTSSSQSQTQSQSSSSQPPGPTSTSTASGPNPSSTSSVPTTSSQPIIRPRAGTGSGAATSAFHSGLTPPTSPPSPPPPGTPLLLPFAGHLSPQNPHCLSHPQAHDYSKGIVTKLILQGKLAPFYRGLEDYEEDWSEEEIYKVLTDLRENDYTENIENSYTEKLKEDREGNSSKVGSVAKKIGINKSKLLRKEEEKEERVKREKKAYRCAVECPICFLNYPPNINTSRCCQQPVCTECFVQIKRSEATLTHLESDPACCPFCMETDFGVIYERPITPLDSSSSVALATSPESEADASSFSQALSLGSEAELSVGPGMNPKMKETVRRKSVSSKAQEVVTIDEIRPDWENKLNAVKAAAARKASRRIVMRQVGDRLIPIGFTSSRAPGTADFSMSVGQQSSSGEPGSRRSSRRSSNRERELEELMIEEAMRLSLMDHEDHQRKLADERRKSSVSSVSSPLNPANASATSISSSLRDSAHSPIIVQSNSQALPGPGPSSMRRSSNADRSSTPVKQSGTSKLLSKINHVRARASSSASNKGNGNGSGDHRSVTFANPSTTSLVSSNNNGSPKPSPPTSRQNSDQTQQTQQSQPTSTSSAPASAPASAAKAVPLVVPTPSHPPNFVHGNNHSQSKHSSGSTGLSPTSPAPVAAGPITTLASPAAERGSHQHKQSNGNGTGILHNTNNNNNSNNSNEGGLPRLSLDMPALKPDSNTHNARASLDDGIKGKQAIRPNHLERMDSEMSEATIGPTTYAQLDSDDE
ncbi:uncharacterized protein I303_103783 [Kwoniella dejecticola CBS 10117]|uniref:Zf-C3HC4 type zinc finger protein n=1 Tax=Kwoniella dejecticola CBS 10117 TaxID=1296121 RepID=A0A1A6A7P9_9TREE|nr:zf-C3HC4 type zinc finger protein [Kwoniella dejecticola CBS 10117]OBR86083.1 zf-C3HC4 type zinc finger protein [Kwoniella dejecticola CBS 10117]